MKHETPKSPQYSGSIQLTLNDTADNTVNNNETFFLLFDVQVLALGHVLPLVTYTITIFYDLNFRLICSCFYCCLFRVFLPFACYVIILVYNMVNIVPIKSAVGIVSWLVFTNYTYILGKIFYVLNNYLERFIKI